MNNQNEELSIISRKLSVLISLQLDSNDNRKSMVDKIKLLDRLGLKTNEIAEILGTSTNSVNVAKNRIKNKK